MSVFVLLESVLIECNISQYFSCQTSAVISPECFNQSNKRKRYFFFCFLELEVLDYKSEKNDTGNLTSDKHKQVEIENWKKKKNRDMLLFSICRLTKILKWTKKLSLSLQLLRKISLPECCTLNIAFGIVVDFVAVDWEKWFRKKYFFVAAGDEICVWKKFWLKFFFY